MDAGLGAGRDWSVGSRRYADCTARNDLPGHCATRRWRLLPELLDRRKALLDRTATGRGFVSDHSCVAVVEGGRAGEVRSVYHDSEGLQFSDSEGSGDGAG